MKFTVELVALERMVGQLTTERGVKGPRKRMMRISDAYANQGAFKKVS